MSKTQSPANISHPFCASFASTIVETDIAKEINAARNANLIAITKWGDHPPHVVVVVCVCLRACGIYIEDECVFVCVCVCVGGGKR